ncbi:MAG: CinA family nicotinamide mononucleotide deamidase-related protein [Desulfobulbales bacterium]
MRGEIIAIGNELTSGRVLNTTSRFAAGLLFGAGHEILSMATIGDTPAEISRTLLAAVKRADFVIVTGGLGATNDDLTNEVVGETLGRPPVFYPEIFAKIQTRHPKITGDALAVLKKLATLPTGAEVLNPEGRMAGYLLVQTSKPIFFLPGVPHEMQELLVTKVIPRLGAWQEGTTKQVKQRVYKVFGLGENEINRRVAHLEKEEDGRVRIGYYPVFPEVHLSLTLIGAAELEMDPIFQALDDEITKALGDFLFGTDDDTLESVIGELLQSRGKMLATAESCTGGLIGHKITSVSGSSNYFAGGVIAYSNDLKKKILDIDASLLSRHGAVSAPVAKAMAAGIRAKTGAHIAVSVTGIAGPTGGTPQKPVGTVFIGLATPDKIIAIPCRFHGNRWQVQELTAVTALDLVRRLLLGMKLQTY